jgi:hypothetical protein
MNEFSASNSLPTDVTFFIGPVGAPPHIKKIYDDAVEQSDAGDGTALEEFLNASIDALRDIADGSPQNPSPLKQLLETLIEREIGEFSTFVAKGYLRKSWTPILTIHLERLKALDGSFLGNLVRRSHGEVIAAMLGKTFKAQWIYTSWTFPAEPINIAPSRLRQSVKEG